MDSKLRTCLEDAIKLVHEVLGVSRGIPEELRIKLTDWRSRSEWELEKEDNGERTSSEF